MFMTLHVSKHQIAVRFRNGDVYDILRPGKHYVRGVLFGDRRDRIVVIDLLQATFVHPRLEELALEPALEDVLSFERLADHEVGVVERDGCVVSVIGPGLHAFPKGPNPATLRRYAVSDVRLEHAHPSAVLAAPGATAHLAELAIPSQHDLVVYLDGALFARVERGRFVYFVDAGSLVGKLVDLREQVLDVSGQEQEGPPRDQTGSRRVLRGFVRKAGRRWQLRRVVESFQRSERALAAPVPSGARATDTALRWTPSW